MKTVKTLLCTIVKNENNYLKEFIDYYKKIGISKIILYDNNDINGETIDINDNIIEIINFRGKKNCQFLAYNECYNKYKKYYDWILFFDCDEFLCLNVQFNNISEYLSLDIFNNYDAIKLNWKLYGDSDIEYLNNNYSVFDRFKNPVLPLDFKLHDSNIPQNCCIKSIIRCKDNLNVEFKHPHYAEGNLRYCNNKGELSNHSPYSYIDYTYAWINHYYTKTVNEYVSKIDRGWPDGQKVDLKEQMYKFFEYNKNTKYKKQIIDDYIKSKSKNIKICVLCMSCNQEVFKYQEMVARNTWIKHLKEEGIDVFIYTSGKHNNVDIENNKIYCNVEDNLNHTYEKTICALSQISTDNFDFIIKTNLTTYINAKLLIKYCEFLKDNNYDISNGCLCIENNLMNYRGNSLIMNRKVVEYLKNNIYINDIHKQDDFIFQFIFKNIPYLKIHSVPFRYYCKEGHFENHPQNIKEINKDNCEGIVFISYRITINPEYNEYDTNNIRCIELGRCYEIDMIYNKLENKELKDNFNIIFSNNDNNFIKYDKDIIQENNKLNIIQETQENIEDILKIYVCAHKSFNQSVVPDKCHEIIWNKDCDNDLNSFNDKGCSEAYQIYEIFKNKDIDKYKYIGICHYRRYYDITNEQIIEYMKTYDCIVKDPHILFDGRQQYTLYTQYQSFYGKDQGTEDIKLIGSIIKHNYPEYLKTYIDVMNGDLFYTNNMCIMKTEDWKKYCKWLFDIIDKFIKKHNWKDYKDIYNHCLNHNNNINENNIADYGRLIGHIAERLMTVYILYNFKNIKAVPLKFIE